MDGPDERKDSHWADVKEIFEPVIVAGRYLSSLLPTRFRLHRPRFNFIAVHYCYMVGMAIVISVMLFPALPMAYIDALFFAAGCATQSGLNTVAGQISVGLESLKYDSIRWSKISGNPNSPRRS
jgi:hypothetical protein